MEKEQIEQLMAEYVSGDITTANRQKLKELFKQEPQLREEANELLGLWQAMDKIYGDVNVNQNTDEQFYAMLQDVKNKHPKATRVVAINKIWLQAAAAILLGITAFGIGRFTTTPAQQLIYKTVYVKQPVQVQSPFVKQVMAAQVNVPVQHQALKKKDVDASNPVLAQQLRSVYASERIGAVMKIAQKPNLTAADLATLELALKEDPSTNVRLTILDALRPLANKESIQVVLISAMNKQNDELIESSIVDLLLNAKSKQAIPGMIALLDDKKTTPNMQNRIKSGIESFLN